MSFFLGGALFYLGVAVSVLGALPFSLNLLSRVGGESLISTFSIRNYITFASLLTFSLGISFELPLLMILVVRLGFISPTTLRKNRKYAIVVSFLVAAFITPTDLFSQAFMAIPLVILYELSLFLVDLFLSGRALDSKSG